jgi:hypothetical protein
MREFSSRMRKSVPMHFRAQKMAVTTENPHESRPQTVPPAYSVQVIRNEDDLAAFRSEWDSLPGNRDSDPTVFTTILRTRSEVIRPHILVVRRNGSACASLVGRIELGDIGFKVGYAHLRTKARILYFSYGGPRGETSADVCNLFVREICRALSAGEADAAYLNFIRDDGALFAASQTIPGWFSRDRIHITQDHFTARLPDSVNAFYAGLSANTRGQLRTKSRRLEKTFPGAVTIRCFKDPGEVEVLAQEAEAIVSKSYQRGLGVGFANTPDIREQLNARAEKGWLLAYVLYLQGQPCAFWIGDLNQGGIRSEYTAYDGDFAKHSPGLYLMSKVIEGFCSDPGRPVHEIDFAMGYAQYKETLANCNWREASVYIYAPTFAGLKLNLMRTLSGGIDKSLKSILQRAGLLGTIKKRWRDRARRSVQTDS